MTGDEDNSPTLWFHAERMLSDPRSPHRQLAKLCAAQGVSETMAHGMFVTFLANAARHLTDDNLAAVTDDTIEQWLRWEFAPGTGAKALRGVLQTDNGQLDWDMLRPWVRRSDPYDLRTGPRLQPPLR